MTIKNNSLYYFLVFYDTTLYKAIYKVYMDGLQWPASYVVESKVK